MHLHTRFVRAKGVSCVPTSSNKTVYSSHGMRGPKLGRNLLSPDQCVWKSSIDAAATGQKNELQFVHIYIVGCTRALIVAVVGCGRSHLLRSSICLPSVSPCAHKFNGTNCACAFRASLTPG